jgi:hypothetical protein
MFRKFAIRFAVRLKTRQQLNRYLQQKIHFARRYSIVTMQCSNYRYRTMCLGAPYKFLEFWILHSKNSHETNNQWYKKYYAIYARSTRACVLCTRPPARRPNIYIPAMHTPDCNTQHHYLKISTNKRKLDRGEPWRAEGGHDGGASGASDGRYAKVVWGRLHIMTPVEISAVGSKRTRATYITPNNIYARRWVLTHKWGSSTCVWGRWTHPLGWEVGARFSCVASCNAVSREM